MNADITITDAGAEHLEIAVDLLQAQLNEHEIATDAAELRRVVQAVIADARHGFIVLAKTSAGPIGIAYAAAHLSAEHGGTVGWLEELYVRPEDRDCGAGSLLLRAVADRARQLGWRALELEVVAGHERAVPLYARHGFVPLTRTRFTRVFAP